MVVNYSIEHLTPRTTAGKLTTFKNFLEFERPGEEIEMARIVNCPCGHTLTGEDNEKLFVLARQHVKEHHPDSYRSDEEIRQLVTQMVQDA